MAMETASWIWRKGEALADEYVDFLSDFSGVQGPTLRGLQPIPIMLLL